MDLENEDEEGTQLTRFNFLNNIHAERNYTSYVTTFERGDAIVDMIQKVRTKD